MLVAGTAWLALAVAERSPKLALTSGILGAGGLLIVLFEDGVSATTPAIAGGLDHAAATGLLERVHSGALAGLKPLSLLGDLGLALLGFAAVKAGASRWTAAAIAAGAFGEAAGFATGNKPLLLISFAVLLAGLAGACAGLMAGQTRLARTGEVMVRFQLAEPVPGMQHPSSPSLTCKLTVEAADWRGRHRMRPDRWPWPKDEAQASKVSHASW